MKSRNIDPLIEQVRASVAAHNLGAPGEYARHVISSKADGKINEYGVSDAANILYTINDFEQAQNDRKHWIRVLQSLQDPETGMYQEPTHHPIHTTAHCIAALDLFDAKPLHKCTFLNDFLTKEGLYNQLENGIRWKTDPWRDSHIGAGAFVALTMTGAVGAEWKDWYFDWLWEHTSPEHGFAFCGEEMTAPRHHVMGGGFHYLFNHEAEHRPMRYPEAVIDFCIPWLLQPREYMEGKVFLNHIGFMEVDLVYCVTRAMRQTPYKFYEAKAALESFADKFLDVVMGYDFRNDPRCDSLHGVFGTMCCVAELQQALPGKIITSKPLRLVLDRRPFI